MSPRPLVVLVALWIPLAVACARRNVRDYPAGTVAGYYVNAFEDGGTFRTCDRRAFRLVAPKDFWTRHQRITDATAEYARPVRVFAIVAASVEPLEESARRLDDAGGKLTVTRVYLMRRAGDDDCARWLSRR